MPSTIEDQRNLVLIEIKPLTPSLKIKFIEFHSKKVKSINLIGIQVNRPSFKYKLEIESDDFYLFICNKYTDIVPISSEIYPN